MNRRPRIAIALAVAPCLALATLAGACSPADQVAVRDTEPGAPGELDADPLQAVLDRWLDGTPAFGASLSVRLPGSDDVHVATGIDDRDPETPMPVDGSYQISSVTKTFVAALVLQLADEGRFSLDEPVRRWLPELAGADEITVEMLLAHTAGLGDWSQPSSPTFDDYVATVTGDLTRSFTVEEALALHTQVPAVAEPGERFFYTDAGYVALGLLLQRELQQDLATVFEMYTRRFGLDDTVLNNGTANGSRHGWFAVDDDPDLPIDIVDLPQNAIATSLWSSASMVSTSPDLLDWAEALYSGDVLGQASTRTMLATDHVVDADDPDVRYGLGVERYCFDGGDRCPGEHDLVGHTGHDGGTTVWMAYDRASGLTVVVHANVDAVDDEDLADLFGAVVAEIEPNS